MNPTTTPKNNKTMISEQLQTEALRFLDQVVSDAQSEARQSAKDEFDKQAAQMQADFAKQLEAEREASYAAGLAAGGAQEPAPTEILALSDGDAYTATKARLVASFSYSRKYKSTKWGSIVLPVALDYADWKARFEIAEIIGVTINADGTFTAKRKVLGEGSSTVPNRPYLIRSKANTPNVAQTIKKQNCQVFPAEPDVVKIVTDGKPYRFRGIYTTMSAADLKGKYYSSGGVFVPATSLCKPMRVILEISE